MINDLGFRIRKKLTERQYFIKTEIRDFEKQIEIRENLIDMLEQIIDAIDEAETEAFNKDRGVYGYNDE